VCRGSRRDLLCGRRKGIRAQRALDTRGRCPHVHHAGLHRHAGSPRLRRSPRPPDRPRAVHGMHVPRLDRRTRDGCSRSGGDALARGRLKRRRRDADCRLIGRRLGLNGRRGRRRHRYGRRRRSNPAAGVGGRFRGTGRRRGQEAQRVEVPLLVGGFPDPEVDVGDVQLGYAARPDGSDGVSLSDGRTAPHSEGAQVHERHRVAIRRLDRHGLSSARDGARERHRARCGSDDRSPGGRADVDPAVLAGRVRMRGIEREGGQHRPCHRPGPAERRGGDDQSSGGGKDQQAHQKTSVVRYANAVTVARPSFVVKSDYSEA